MSFLRSIFGPSKDEIWSQIAKDIDGQYTVEGFFGRDVLRYRSGEWGLTLDTYVKSQGNYSYKCTRLRAPFVNKDGLYFRVYKEGFFSSIGKFLGMQDIEIGDPFFDQTFVIQGNHEEKIRLLLRDDRLKNLIRTQPNIHFEIQDNEGWSGIEFPQGVDQLYFECVGFIQDEERLKHLFEMFAVTLERLVQIDSAYEADPRVVL